MTEKQLKTNLLNIDVWVRLIYMVIFGLLLMLARVLIWVVAALQFLLILITAHDNKNLRNFGQGLSKWVFQGLLFLTFNSEEKPYPFNDWPDVEEVDGYEIPEEEATADESPESPEAVVETATEAGADVEAASEHSGGEAEVELDDDPIESDVPSFTEGDDTDESDRSKS